MSIAVKIESPVGTTLQTRNFQPGQQVRVGGHLSGFPSFGNNVRVELRGLGNVLLFADTTRSNLLGDFWFDITMPREGGEYTLKFLTDEDSVEVSLTVRPQCPLGWVWDDNLGCQPPESTYIGGGSKPQRPASPGPGYVWDDNLGWLPPESTYLIPGTGTLLPGLLPPMPLVKTEQIKKLLIGAAILLGIGILFKGK